MEIIEIPATESANGTHQSHWLRDIISDAEEKMKDVLNLWEENHSLLQNDQMYERRKETVTKEVQDLCKSYCSLAEKYDRLKSATTNSLSSRSSSLSNNVRSHFHDMKHKDISGSWDVCQLEAIGSNPESTREDAEIECNGTTHDLEHLKTLVHNLIHKDDNCNKPENAWLDREKFKMSKLVEENTRLQVELIRRNNEKREAIKKLQNQVNRLVDENHTLQRCLSYYDRNKQFELNSPKRKTALVDKIFRGCS